MTISAVYLGPDFYVVWVETESKEQERMLGNFL